MGRSPRAVVIGPTDECTLRTMADWCPYTPHDPHMDVGLYPSTWVMNPWDPEAIFLKVPMHRLEPAYAKIEAHFHSTLSKDLVMVFSIYRIQNKFLWQKYKWQKEFLSHGRTEAEKLYLERNLYHGTSQHNLDLICYRNFDPRLSGTHGTAYGDGSYFALDASYSHKYTQRACNGYRHMFLAKVLVGRMAPGKAFYRLPPPLGAAGALYDSCVDDISNPKIFVVFDSCQCYPFFLIQYKLLSEPIIVDE